VSLIGRQIGRYRILEQVGQGGMSVVYKGLDTTLEREVAVKVLHPHLASKIESRRRLEREAKAVARLHHPNILEVFDFAGSDAQDAYIVTEYIRGRTLRQFITDDTLQPPEVAAMVMHEVAAALAHAHDAGIIHRDLKPENIMLREDGVLKLMDFGIAKILDRDEKMTMTGALVGSPAHMAPEIIEGEEAGAEADVFSLGTMLYLFATGKLPFTAPNTTATLKRILDCMYDDPRQVVPTVSDELAEIIATCLQRQPASRYPTASKLRDALASYLADLGLTRPHEELPKFFLDPKGYRKALVPRMTAALLGRAEKLIHEKRSAKALSALNQVLAHEPGNEKAQALLALMKAKRLREQRSKRLLRAALVLGGVFVVSMGTWRGVEVALRAPDPEAVGPLEPQQVALAGVSWPKPPPPPEVKPETPEVKPETPVNPVVVAKVDPNKVKHPVEAKDPVESPKLADVRVIVRPFGYLKVDDGQRSKEALQVHMLKLAPGLHHFTVTCDRCENQGESQEVTVRSSSDAPILMVAPLKPSLVSFAGFPPDAVVRVGTEERTVAATKTNPFRITNPKAGSKEMRYHVNYEVLLGGKTIASGSQPVAPGEPAVISKEAP